MKYILPILLLLLLNSCYSVKKAARQVDKAHSEHELIVAEKCGNWYPVKVDTIQGETVYLRTVDTVKGKTIYVNCDSIVSKSKGDSTVITKFVPVDCPDNITITDVLKEIKYVTKENTARLRESEIKLDAEITNAKKWKITGIIFIILFAMSAIGNYILIKRK